MTKFPKVTKRAVQNIDATGIPVGRLASTVSGWLIGKHRVDFARHLDAGDFVEVKNVARARWTGNKLQTKVYRHHTGYPGGLKEERLSDLWAKSPAEVLRRAVWSMLPKTRHRKEMAKRLRIT